MHGLVFVKQLLGTQDCILVQCGNFIAGKKLHEARRCLRELDHASEVAEGQLSMVDYKASRLVCITELAGWPGLRTTLWGWFCLRIAGLGVVQQGTYSEGKNI